MLFVQPLHPVVLHCTTNQSSKLELVKVGAFSPRQLPRGAMWAVKVNTETSGSLSPPGFSQMSTAVG